MRDFSEFEKNVIRNILNVYSKPGSLTVLGNILEHEIDPNIYISLETEISCPVKIKVEYFESIVRNYGAVDIFEVLKKLETKLLLTVKLIEYLERENYLILSSNLEIESLGTVEVDVRYADYNLNDSELIKYLFLYSRKKITPTEGLTKLVNNKFKSDEEIRNEREYQLNRKLFRWTAASVIIAGIALVVSSMIPLFQKEEISLNKETILSLDSVLSKNDSVFIINPSLLMSVDSITLRKVFNDTGAANGLHKKYISAKMKNCKIKH